MIVDFELVARNEAREKGKWWGRQEGCSELGLASTSESLSTYLQRAPSLISNPAAHSQTAFPSTMLFSKPCRQRHWLMLVDASLSVVEYCGHDAGVGLPTMQYEPSGHAVGMTVAFPQKAPAGQRPEHCGPF